MSKTRITLNALTFVLFTLALGVFAQAQATRTWVSGVGDDVNPCSRTAPCKTFAGAISKTAAGGEIDALDPGGFGTITITKSITIDGGTGSGWASILASATQGVVVNDTLSASPNSSIVILRNLSINGAGTTLGTNGISVIGAESVYVENVRIARFSGDGIRYVTSVRGRLVASNVDISQCGGDGIEIGGTNAVANDVLIEDSQITRCNNGVRLSNRAIVAITDSNISTINLVASSTAILADSAVNGGNTINVENCRLNFNSIAVQANTNQTVRLSNAHITANGTALNFAGGVIASYGNNKIAGNVGGEAFASLTDILQQ
jgi:hypothetical protein